MNATILTIAHLHNPILLFELDSITQVALQIEPLDRKCWGDKIERILFSRSLDPSLPPWVQGNKQKNLQIHGLLPFLLFLLKILLIALAKCSSNMLFRSQPVRFLGVGHSTCYPLILTSFNFRSLSIHQFGLLLLKSIDSLSSDVLYLVNFADLRSKYYTCEIVLFPLSPLPVLLWACFVWLFQSWIGAWDCPLKRPHLDDYCLPVIFFGDKVSVTCPNIKA